MRVICVDDERLLMEDTVALCRLTALGGNAGILDVAGFEWYPLIGLSVLSLPGWNSF